MKIKILLMLLCLYANCQGASKALTNELTAQQASIAAQVNADRKSKNDVSTAKTVEPKSDLLKAQEAALHTVLTEQVFKQSVPGVLNTITEYLYARKYKCIDKIKSDSLLGSIIQLQDGRLTSASYDGTIRIWDLTKPKGNDPKKDARCVEIIENIKIVICIVELSDGKLASVSDDRTIKIWDLTKSKGDDPKVDARCVDTLEGHRESVFYIIQLADGMLASCSRDNTIRIWDLTKPKGQKCVYTLEGHTDWVTSIMQLGDGELVSTSADKTIRIWDLTQGKYNCIQILKGHAEAVYHIIQLKDGRLVSSSLDGKILIWNLNNEEEYECVQVIKADSIRIVQLADFRLATVHSDGKIRVWDLTKGKGDDANKDQRCVQVLEGHTDTVNRVIQLACGQLASTSDDETIRIWTPVGEKDLTRLDLVRKFPLKQKELRTFILALISPEHEQTRMATKSDKSQEALRARDDTNIITRLASNILNLIVSQKHPKLKLMG